MAAVANRTLPRFFQIARRIAKRFSPKLERAFMRAVSKFQGQIDEVELRQAVASGSVLQIQAAVATGGNLQVILEGERLDVLLQGTSAATGAAGADVLEGVTGLAVQFNRMSPRVVMYARAQTGDLVAEIGAQLLETIRIVTALGAGMGLTITEQARALREVIALPSIWANAPLNLRQNIIDGDAAAATARRLSGVDKAQIRARIKAGTVDNAFLDKMQARYTQSLLQRRALNIARTESLRAAHAGQREGWKQAVQQGVLPDTATRFWIVTPDERLSFEHSLIPGMNQNGRGLDEAFHTPEGRFLDPPIRTNCRCGTGLMFPGLRGVL